jgi:hypothetical protein
VLLANCEHEKGFFQNGNVRQIKCANLDEFKQQAPDTCLRRCKKKLTAGFCGAEVNAAEAATSEDKMATFIVTGERTVQRKREDVKT